MEDISGLDKEEIIRRGEDYEREIKKQNDAGIVHPLLLRSHPSLSSFTLMTISIVRQGRG